MSPPGPDAERDDSALRHLTSEGLFPPVPAPRLGATLAAALGLGLLLALASATAETATIRGAPEVLDGRRMVLAGQEIKLADIEVPSLGQPCRIRGHPLDCGRLARAGLIDIVVGGKVECSTVGNGQHRCFAGGYDIGFGLVHAGWAVAAKHAPARYLAKMSEARERGRGLWSAVPEIGDEPSVAHRLRP